MGGAVTPYKYIFGDDFSILSTSAQQLTFRENLAAKWPQVAELMNLLSRII